MASLTGKLVGWILRWSTIVATASVLTWTGYDPHVTRDADFSLAPPISVVESHSPGAACVMARRILSSLDYHPPGRIGAKRYPGVLVDRIDGFDRPAIVRRFDPPTPTSVGCALLVIAVRARPPPR